jgi:Uma2 family endonuclease
MTLDEFLGWWDEQPGDQRYELAHGEVFAMGREAAGHIRLKFATTVALQAGIEKAGLPCETFIDGLGISISNDSYFVPDAVVVCGGTVNDDTSLIDNPVIVVEVLSPGTKVFDVDLKLGYYFQKMSLQHYLIVDGKNRLIVHHRRVGERTAETTIVREGTITLDPPGLVIALDDVFQRAS